MNSLSDITNYFRYVSTVQGSKSLFFRFIRPKNVPKGESVFDSSLIQFYEHDVIHAMDRSRKKYFEGNHRILLYPHKLEYSFKSSTKNKNILFKNENLSLQELNFVIFDVDVNAAHKNELDISHTHAKDIAFKVVHKIKDYLHSYGFKKLLMVDSGNGYHLMCPLKIPLSGDTPKYNEQLNSYAARCKALTDKVREAVRIDEFSDYVNIDPVYNSNTKQLVKCAGSVNRKHWEDFQPRLSKIIYPMTNGGDANESLKQNTALFQKIPIPRYLESFSLENTLTIVNRDFIENDKLTSDIKNPTIARLLGVYNSRYYASKVFKFQNNSRNEIESKMVCDLLNQGFICFEDVDRIMCLLLAEVVDAKWLSRDVSYRMSVFETANKMNSN